ncbi:hypothetical protein KI387_017907 [Taxus chinensis]|uniref:Hexosyltransferase n=1 Tax=Taxus chinensis TaxID=29808 RepID=A0AA38LFT0_TAXCH|nr:hypothetical protein KI387_017907 [Taxus chinensis]
MQLHISPSLRHISISTTNGFWGFMKGKAAVRHFSYRNVLYSILILAFLLRFVFILSALASLEGENNCSSLGESLTFSFVFLGKIFGLMGLESGTVTCWVLTFSELYECAVCLGRKLGPRFLGKTTAAPILEKELYEVLQAENVEVPEGLIVPDTFESFVADLKTNQYDARTFGFKIKAMVERLEQKTRYARMQEYLYRHIASSSIPKGMNCLSLRLADEYSSNSKARKNLPAPELVSLLTDNSYQHFVLATDNVLAASVVVSSAVRNSAKPEKIVFHVITDKMTYAPMHAWFALHPLPPAIIELFPDLEKVVFLDDDIVVQHDLSPLWDIDLHGKVNGAVETCRGDDSWVMSKRFKSYFNFSHPLIAENFDPEQCAWAYGMNILDLQAWRRTNIGETYHYWLKQNLNSNLRLWRMGTLPPALIAFNGLVHPIDQSWHMLGLGYQPKTNLTNIQKAAVIHYNGRAKPWLDIAFPELRPLWAKYVDFSDEFIKHCNIIDSEL